MNYMLIGAIKDKDKADDEWGEPSQVLVLRFYSRAAETERYLRLGKKQAKQRYPKIDQSQIEWDVYQLADRNGFPVLYSSAESLVN